MMCLGDGPGDDQADTHAAPRPRTGRDLIVDTDAHAPPAEVAGDCHQRAGRGFDDCVADEVEQRLPQFDVLAEDMTGGVAPEIEFDRSRPCLW